MRRTLQRSLWLLGMVASTTASALETQLVRVTADNVNLRAQPDVQSEVVGQSSEGDILIAKSFNEEWVEIVPEDRLDLWVHSEFVSEGEVMASELNIRAGAGINYSIVGNLSRGDKVNIRGEFGEWLRIEPPFGSSLWISREFVENVEPTPARERGTATMETAQPPSSTGAASEPAGTPGPGGQASAPQQAAASSGAEDEEPVVTRPPPDDLALVPLEGQGRVVQKQGLLKRVSFLTQRPARYRLVRKQRGQQQTVCYLRGNRRQLEALVGQELTVRGGQYWVQGAQFPVVIPEQIVPHGKPPPR